MTAEERWKMLSKEQIKMNQAEGEAPLTKEEEIKGLESLIKCMKHFEEHEDEELKKIYEEGLKEIENKYL